MGKLCFDDIKDWNQFEELAAAYLRRLPEILGNPLKSVEVEASGTGADGGVDLLAHIAFDDGILTITRTYIVQCKFYEGSVGLKELGAGSITDLIMAHDASGYLLICKKMVKNKLKERFRMLSKNCRFKYSYEIWSGEEFLVKLQKAPADVIRQFFPGSL